MAQYADWLDNLERTDPDGYQRLLHAMKAQVDSAEAPVDTDAALFEALGRVYIDVLPGFVMKTRELQSSRKGLHVPLSLGAPHEVTDKKGAAALAFDVAVNTQVVDDCRKDSTGAFRNFVCELAIEYIDQKFKIQLDARYKLPRLSYRGELPPPQHYIRKTQTPIIQEVASGSPATSRTTRQPTPAATAPRRAPASNPTSARVEIHEVVGVAGARVSCSLCTRVPAVEKNGTALSHEILAQAGDELKVTVSFASPVTSADDVEVELRAELLYVKAFGHHDL
ncbi:hypothetical protein PybrP1_006124, partial [[Pythium] brassicae (nom. inval.)]